MFPVPTIEQLKAAVDAYHAAHGRPPQSIHMTLPQWVRFREKLRGFMRFADGLDDVARKRAEARFEWPTVGEFFGVPIKIGALEDLP